MVTEMTLEDGRVVRLDRMGRVIHNSRRGPVPGSGNTVDNGRNTEYIQVRIPKELMTELNERARKDAASNRAGSGRSGIVREALSLMFYGDAVRWKKRYLEERQARLLLERKIERIREAMA